MLCIETSAFLGSLQKFDGVAGEFKGALGSQLTLISSPGILPVVNRNMLDSTSAFIEMLVVNIREYIQYFIGLKHALNTLTLLGSEAVKGGGGGFEVLTCHAHINQECI